MVLKRTTSALISARKRRSNPSLQLPPYRQKDLLTDSPGPQATMTSPSPATTTSVSSKNAVAKRKAGVQVDLAPQEKPNLTHKRSQRLGGVNTMCNAAGLGGKNLQSRPEEPHCSARADPPSIYPAPLPSEAGKEEHAPQRHIAQLSGSLRKVLSRI